MEEDQVPATYEVAGTLHGGGGQPASGMRMGTAAYQFFDAGFQVESDSRAFLAEFERSYARFRAEPGADWPVYRVSLAGEPWAHVGGRRVTAADAEALRAYAHTAILNAATARVRSHALLHAAALRSPGGAGLIVAGEAGMGKTTLVQALLARGFGFLSDEVAAVRLADGELAPFPRSLGVRTPGAGGRHKQAVAVAEVAEACPARFLFLLAERGGAPPAAPWHLTVDRPAPGLAEALRAVPGVRAAEVARAERYPVLRLELAPGAWPGVEPGLEEACRRAGALPLDLARGREAAPDFGREPVLSHIEPAEAARALLRHLKGGARNALVASSRGQGGWLLARMVGLTLRMESWRLEVGRLEATVERIAAEVG